MPLRFVLAFSLMLALFAPPAGNAALICVAKIPQVQAKSCDCCSTMKCCVAPKGKAPQPAPPLIAHAQSLAIAMPASAVSVCGFSEIRVLSSQVVRRSAAVGPPRLALFCTFLI